MRKIHLTLLFLFLTSFIYAQEPFITVWQPFAFLEDSTITVPIVYDSNNNYTIDFGDGTVLTNQTGPCTHTYVYSGESNVVVTVSGTFGHIDFSTLTYDEANSLYAVQQWGDVQWTSMENAFHGCTFMVLTAADTPDLSQVTSMEGMFYGTTNLNLDLDNPIDPIIPLDLNDWDVSNVTNMKDLFKNSSIMEVFIDNWDVSNVTTMEGMFSNCEVFNSPINSWNVSNVTNMKEMFLECDIFNQPLNNWDVSSVEDMHSMFENAKAFNQPLNSWDVSSVEDMQSMFQKAEDFNQPLNNWDVSNVTNMSHMFDYALVFNQPLNGWDTSNVTNMSYMFKTALLFDEQIGNWDVSSVTDMSYMFFVASSFNQSIDNWDVSSVENMHSMFENAKDFNQPLNNWDVSAVTDMFSMFENAEDFNQSLNYWDVSNVTTMARMFYNALSFNGEIDNWDVTSVTTTWYMFHAAVAFNQPLNSWDVSNISVMWDMFSDAISFNQPLDNWDVSNVTDLAIMFEYASSFNQDLSSWDFSSMSYDFFGFVSGTAMSTQNYDALLLRFAQQEIENQTISSYDIHYCDSEVRNHLINDLGWTFIGDALGEECQGNTINGTVLFDEDNNGCDSNDIAMVNFLVKANNDAFSYATTVGADGQYELKTFAETNYEIEVLGIPDYYTIVPETSSVSFTGYGNTEEVAFCVSSNEVIQDLSILILPVNEARPGFEAEYQLVVENLGIQSIPTVTVNFTYNDAMQSFVSALPTASSNSGNVLTFTLADFQPFESRTIDIVMQTFTPPTVNGDDVLNFTATVTPNQNDYTPEDNTFDFEQVVVNSFDPNDKRVVQGSEIYPEQTDEYLDYIIRFQNTGTASAINIRVKDVLSDEVDWNTLRPVSSSHEYRLEITDGNQVEFIFENINLPFEGEDEAGSNGFIAYKIKPVAGLEVGDIIHGNEVNIYFDYNLPIITNSVTTEVVSLMGVNDYALNSSIVLYPNPANDILHLKSENSVAPEMVAIYNLQGRELMSFNQNMENMNISGLSAGVYLITVKTSQGSAQYKLIKE